MTNGNNGHAEPAALGGGDYRQHQAARDAEYSRACDAFIAGKTPEELAQLKAAGVLREVTRKSGRVDLVFADTGREDAPTRGRGAVGAEDDARTLCEDSLAFCDWPKFDVDRLPEMLREKFGIEVASSVEIAKYIADIVKRAEMQTTAHMLSRVVGMFLATEKNIHAQAHGLAHAARLAQQNGYLSLRESARACGISAEWMRKCAWKWCELLGLPQLEGAKSDEAREAYKKNANNNHWRKQTCKPTPQKPPQTKRSQETVRQ